MITNDDGGPAFPLQRQVNEYGVVVWMAQPGMTLREYFAAHLSEGAKFDSVEQAAAFLGEPAPPQYNLGASVDVVTRALAKLAYAYADAMIAERSK